MGVYFRGYKLGECIYLIFTLRNVAAVIHGYKINQSEIFIRIYVPSEMFPHPLLLLTQSVALRHPLNDNLTTPSHSADALKPKTNINFLWLFTSRISTGGSGANESLADCSSVTTSAGQEYCTLKAPSMLTYV